jgi:hypothetical protein
MRGLRHRTLWGVFMISSFLKVVPILTLLGVGASAQQVAAQTKAMKTPVMQSAVCGINENECCLARSCKCALGGALEFDFLYWRADNAGFTYAYDQKDPNYVEGPALNNIGSVMRLDPKWDPGFRVGAGWNTDFDRWDVFADWTWFRDKSHESDTRDDITTATSVMGYIPIFPLETNNDTYKSVSATWHLWHNAVDLELGRAYYLTKSLSLRPHWGARGASINQKFKTSFTMPLDAGSYSQYDFHGKNNFWGIGPRVGIHAKWHINDSSWSVLGKASGSLILGPTKTKYRVDTLAVGATTFVTERDIRDHFSQLVPNLQLFLGFDWGSCLNNEQYWLGINAGWEANIYWNQFNLPTAIWSIAAPLPGIGNQAVTMEGLTVNVHLDF